MAATAHAVSDIRARARNRTAAGRAAALALTALAWLAATAAPALGRAAVRARDIALQAGGLALLSYAAWQWHDIAGYAAAGASLLLLQWLLTPDES